MSRRGGGQTGVSQDPEQSPDDEDGSRGGLQSTRDDSDDVEAIICSTSDQARQRTKSAMASIKGITEDFPGAYSGQGRSWEIKTREAI